MLYWKRSKSIHFRNQSLQNKNLRQPLGLSPNPFEIWVITPFSKIISPMPWTRIMFLHQHTYQKYSRIEFSLYTVDDLQYSPWCSYSWTILFFFCSYFLCKFRNSICWSPKYTFNHKQQSCIPKKSRLSNRDTNLIISWLVS